MTKEQRIYQADQAKLILENEVFNQVFEDIREELTQAWIQSPQRDQEGREKLHLSVILLNKIQANLITTLETGKLAKLDLEYESKMRELKRGVVSLFA